MAIKAFSLRLVRATARRAIGFLLADGDESLNAADVFDGLPERAERYLNASFDHWVGGNDNCKTRYHGFPNDPMHKDCFTFKWRTGRLEHRFYGFLCNPKPKSDPAFRLCVLIYHDPKIEWLTNSNLLHWATHWRTDLRVMEAISKVFPQYGGDDPRWEN